MVFSERLCSIPFDDSKLIVPLLTLRSLAFDSVDDREAFVGVVIRSIHLFDQAESGEPDEFILPLADSKVKMRCVDWIMSEMRASIESIDFVIRQLRTAIKNKKSIQIKSEPMENGNDTDQVDQTVVQCAKRYG